MFKGHPKGLYALALANTGERFGYYTMLAIFVLFLQAKFGYNEAQAGNIYGIFLGCVYFMPLIGGILADRFGYGKMVTAGIVVMFLGYFLLAFPLDNAMAKVGMFAALALVAMGTGLFKGNLQVMVGNLYDEAKYSAFRDNGFSLFYMAINIGSMFAPITATKVTDLFLDKAGFSYVPQIPSLAHQYLDGNISADALSKFEALAVQQGYAIDNLSAFSNDYINTLSKAYNYGFGVACISLVLSIAIYLCCRRWFKHADVNTKQAKQMAHTTVYVEELSREQTRSRIMALALVFVVVIFFWMSFQQSGLCLTYFARDYTASTASGFTRIGFNIWALTLIAISVYTLFSALQSKVKKSKYILGAVTLLLWAGAYALYKGMDDVINTLPQQFQQFNPFFVVALTPVAMAVFSTLAKRGKEPSSPRKIGMGMVVAAMGFLIMALASVHLASPAALKSVGGVSDVLVPPNWLISTYLVLTFAELLLSPIGISFVTKVAPPKYKGMMMGMWFCVTAIGNYLTSVIARIWGTGMPLWMVWGVLVVLCLLSAVFIFAIMKRLERVTQGC
ncbi:MAG: peptide MFS transporter [Candidatus Limimorpha sp.]